MTGSCSAEQSGRRRRASNDSRPACGSAGWSCSRTRRGLSTARTAIVGATTLRFSSPSWAVRFGRGGRGTEREPSLRASCPGRAARPRSGGGSRSPSGICPARRPRVSRLLARYNAILAGWWQYYGSFYPTAVWKVFRHFDLTLAWWARRKYKALRGHKHRSRRWLAKVARRERELFVHWRLWYGTDSVRGAV